ncbi:MAG: RHS repeat-associated core domain-containing protein [Marinobacter sp.]
MTRTIWNTLAVLIFTALPLSAVEVVTYYHNDHLGSPIAATDSTGAVVWQQAYDPWGFKLTTNTDERGYTGNWLDEETGLADHKARWYTSSIGRFTGIDPVKWHETNIHSFNRYSYSGNNPYTNTDVGGDLFFSFHMNRRDMSTKHAMIAGQVGNVGAQTAMGLHAAGGAAKLVVGGARSLLKMGLKGANVTKWGVKDFPEVAAKVSQKQLRHIKNNKNYRGGGVLNSVDDAQHVLDAYRSGVAKIIGKTKQGFPVVKYRKVTGTNINTAAGYTNQPTNVFMIKGSKSPSVVPMNPNWRP